jgi:flagellar biosynthesis/type III secretory pathway M-ring protein FliF/YscJ
VANAWAIITIVPSTSPSAFNTLLIAILIVVVVVALIAIVALLTRERREKPREPKTRQKGDQPASAQSDGQAKSSTSTQANGPVQDSKGHSAIPCPECHTLAAEGTKVCEVCGCSLENAWKSVSK